MLRYSHLLSVHAYLALRLHKEHHVIEVSECDGNLFFVVINFEYANTSDEFKVVGNGNNYGTYAYADLPITIDGLEADCDLQFEFGVQDLEFNDCGSAIGIGEVCCDDEECDLFDLDFDVSECDGDYFKYIAFKTTFGGYLGHFYHFDNALLAHETDHIGVTGAVLFSVPRH